MPGSGRHAGSPTAHGGCHATDSVTWHHAERVIDPLQSLHVPLRSPVWCAVAPWMVVVKLGVHLPSRAHASAYLAISQTTVPQLWPAYAEEGRGQFMRRYVALVEEGCGLGGVVVRACDTASSYDWQYHRVYLVLP